MFTLYTKEQTMSQRDEWVVVTGASTGIGRATALELAGRGIGVFAGVRKAADGAALRDAAPPGLIEPVSLDVRDAGQIDALADRVRASGVRLRALVNNAAVIYPGPVEAVPVDQWRDQFEVNLFGPLRLTQALLPLLRESRGRVINVSSIGGLCVTPCVGAYQASKYALEAASDALRLETSRQGVQVVLIEPGAIRTPLWDKGTAGGHAVGRSLSPEHHKLYGGMVRKLTELIPSMNKLAIEPEAVARVIAKATLARRPRTRYLVGRDAKAMWLMKRRLPDRWFDAAVKRFMGLGDKQLARYEQASAPAAGSATPA
jgi:NAD(P)-dependent dehydrogenase (short-subunit alcohol dehydrogenase family)